MGLGKPRKEFRRRPEGHCVPSVIPWMTAILYMATTVVQDERCENGEQMKDFVRSVWRLVVDVSRVLRAGLALLDYYDRHNP